MEDNEKVQKILLDIQWLRDSILRLQSNAESERSVRKDTHIEIHKRISELDKLIREIIYDSDKGFLIRIDRLTIESKEREKMKSHIRGLWVGLALTVITAILSYLLR